MRLIFLLLIAFLSGCSARSTSSQTCFHSHSLTLLSGKTLALKDFSGKVLVLTNFSLGCGTTPQLLDLQKLYSRYQSKGLEIIGFPSNDFVDKEINAKPHIKDRCLTEFGITFPLAAPIKARADDLFTELVRSGPPEMQGPVTFHMEKFIVDKKGRLRARYGSFSNPLGTEIVETVEKLLAEEYN
jgi:glutathione peroxidase